MKTHMSNTVAKKLDNDIVGHSEFIKHQEVLHSHIKSKVETRRKSEVKIVQYIFLYSVIIRNN